MRQRGYDAKLACLSVYSDGSLKCACCGEHRIPFLTLDHIDNDGAEWRRKNRKGGTAFFLYLVSKGFPKDHGLRVLCFNCNCGRRSSGQNGVCPHEEES